MITKTLNKMKKDKDARIKARDARKRSEKKDYNVKDVVRVLAFGRKPTKKVHSSSKNVTIKEKNKEVWKDVAEYAKKEILK